MSREQRNALLALRRIAEAVSAVVNDTPNGAPAGVMRSGRGQADH
jgi:hypothetical protein